MLAGKKSLISLSQVKNKFKTPNNYLISNTNLQNPNNYLYQIPTVPFSPIVHKVTIFLTSFVHARI